MEVAVCREEDKLKIEICYLSTPKLELSKSLNLACSLKIKNGPKPPYEGLFIVYDNDVASKFAIKIQSEIPDPL